MAYFNKIQYLKRPYRQYIGKYVSIASGWWTAPISSSAESSGALMDYQVNPLFLCLLLPLAAPFTIKLF
jgi:hypothetical protein